MTTTEFEKWDRILKSRENCILFCSLKRCCDIGGACRFNSIHVYVEGEEYINQVRAKPCHFTTKEVLHSLINQDGTLQFPEEKDEVVGLAQTGGPAGSVVQVRI